MESQEKKPEAKRRRVAKFEFFNRIDGVNGGVLYIDRQTGIIGVRPKRRRRTYELPLSEVAISILQRVVIAELPEKKRRHRVRRGLL